jgi:hypothetical protein
MISYRQADLLNTLNPPVDIWLAFYVYHGKSKLTIFSPDARYLIQDILTPPIMRLAHNFDVQLDNQKFTTKAIPSGSTFQFSDNDRIDINHIVAEITREVQASGVLKAINVDKVSNSKCFSYHLTGRSIKKKADLLETFHDKVKFWLVIFQHVSTSKNYVKLYCENNRFLDEFGPVIRQKVSESLPGYDFNYFPQNPYPSLRNMSRHIQFPMGDIHKMDGLRDELRHSIRACQLMNDGIHDDNGGSVRLIEFEARL